MKKPLKSADIPVTKSMLDEVRSELKSDITDLSLQTKAGFVKQSGMTDDLRSEMKAGFVEQSRMTEDLRSEVSGKIDSLASEMRSGFLMLQSEMKKMGADVHRTKCIVEEQNNKINFALDGYAQVYEQIQELKETKADKVDTV